MRSGAAIKYHYGDSGQNQVLSHENNTPGELEEVKTERIFEPPDSLKLPTGMLIVSYNFAQSQFTI